MSTLNNTFGSASLIDLSPLIERIGGNGSAHVNLLKVKTTCADVLGLLFLRIVMVTGLVSSAPSFMSLCMYPQLNTFTFDIMSVSMSLMWYEMLNENTAEIPIVDMICAASVLMMKSSDMPL
ncbi:hypothetical protein E8E13_004920 [Curvularia kusanoi]|uniref:Uncharacterized protein n=1 Tax=Curvularia kusanoi TaxID=90978 RepID=A0A9P4WDZ6_CURKU|nr:hypothetical protein E8E13_004920 [Curvularia kusanoi]